MLCRSCWDLILLPGALHWIFYVGYCIVSVWFGMVRYDAYYLHRLLNELFQFYNTVCPSFLMLVLLANSVKCKLSEIVSVHM
jgi:hypothetical protein